MRLLGLGNKEPAYCWLCNNEIKGISMFSATTKSGKKICSKCMTKTHLEDIRSKIDDMDDDEIQLFLEIIEDSEGRKRDFTITNKFQGYKLEVDQVQQCVKFEKHHYIFEIEDIIAVVHNLMIEGNHVTGTLQFHTIDPYYPYIKVEVDARARGFFKSDKIKDLSKTLEEISASMGGVPVLSPKEYSKCYRELYNERMEEIEAEMNLLL